MNNFMKTALLTAVALVAFCGSASAITIVCGNTGNLASGTGSGSIGCPALDAGFGNALTNVFITRTGDASTILTLSPNPIVTFTWGSAGGFSGLVYTLTGFGGIGGGFTASPTTPNISASQNPGQTFGAFNMTFSSSVTGGTLTSSSGVLILDYTISAVPEPMTMSLMGAGLLALGLAGRRFRRS